MGELMAHLIKCIECGWEMSSEARSCPNCHTQFPNGRVCTVCNKVGRDSDLTSGKYNEELKTYSMHAACFAEIYPCQYSCPVCKKSVITHVRGCSMCGHPFEMESCRYCGESLIKDTAVKISKKVLEKENKMGMHYHDFFDYFAHKACYSSRHSSSSCFIATAALDSPLAPEVKTLQTFRDNVLRKYHFGRRFIALYESVSPPFAHIIAQNNVLRYLTRVLIVYPATWLAKWTLKQ